MKFATATDPTREAAIPRNINPGIKVHFPYTTHEAQAGARERARAHSSVLQQATYCHNMACRAGCRKESGVAERAPRLTVWTVVSRPFLHFCAI